MRCVCSEVTAVELKKKCRYHRREDQTYTCDSIAPKGLCLDAFHVVYPYCLALLYDADFKGSCHNAEDGSKVVIQCPLGELKMNVERVQTLPKPIKVAKTLGEKVFKKLFFPPDVPDYNIRITVSDVSDKCPHEKGEEFFMNIRSQNELCPASFDAVYPFLDSKELEYIHCPDHEGILYQLEKK